jgi:membrane protein DedA with SNARE-associated domain
MLVFLTVVAADAIGTIILFVVFYYFGEQFFKHKPRWIPLSRERLAHIEEKISRRGVWSIYVGRLIPYVRGYTSVAAGLLRIRPRVFIRRLLFRRLLGVGDM